VIVITTNHYFDGIRAYPLCEGHAAEMREACEYADDCEVILYQVPVMKPDRRRRNLGGRRP
jgi:hypothetical protein